MSDRVVNFAAGPAILPRPVLEEVQRDLLSLPGVGASALEVSHRGPWFEGVIAEAEANLRTLLAIPASHHVVFCQGGATQQFSMVADEPPPRRRPGGRLGGHRVVGDEGGAGGGEGGAVRIAWTGEADGFRRVPTDADLAGALATGAAYTHITTNETIQGVEFPTDPAAVGDVPLVADMSSDFLSRPVDVARYGVIYAGAQKNARPRGRHDRDRPRRRPGAACPTACPRCWTIGRSPSTARCTTRRRCSRSTSRCW